ncbi:metal-dependent hydrolase [Falsibacillus pallidus]|uniref:metal-dependent hydrolase n=1 Tax=Falsibacillus pallidus TaxID=493781 RepID=UPI003D982392
MKGTAHLAIGTAAGFIIGNTQHFDLSTNLMLAGLGGISGLMPDMDIDSVLTNKITISHKVFRTIAQVVGALLIIYSYLDGGFDKWKGICAGVGVIVLSSFLTQRRMLTMTGIGVLLAGYSLGENWLWLLGIYIIGASLIPHRSYTHSILGVIFFGVIASKFEASIGMQGAFAACLAGYISHLIADMKFLPANKRGVKLFLPFSSKEI